MPRYIKKADGKLAGSIGDGKTKIPTGAQHPSLPGSLTGTPAEPSSSTDAAYARFEQSRPAPSEEKFILTSFTDGIGGQISAGPYTGTLDRDDNDDDPEGPWGAWIESYLPADDEYTTVASKKFHTEAEGKAWVMKQTTTLAIEVDDFEKFCSDAEDYQVADIALNISAIRGANFNELSGYDIDQLVMTQPTITYRNKEALITSAGDAHYTKIDVDGETRHYVEFNSRKRAEAFALLTILRPEGH